MAAMWGKACCSARRPGVAEPTSSVVDPETPAFGPLAPGPKMYCGPKSLAPQSSVRSFHSVLSHCVATIDLQIFNAKMNRPGH